MIKYFYLLLFLVCSIIGCNQKANYAPPNLRKLTELESMERNLNGIPPAMDVKFKSTDGKELSEEALEIMLKEDEYFMDEYVDGNDIVREFVLRKSTSKDEEWLEELQRRLHEKENTPLEITEVDCQAKAELLKQVYESDQANRIDPDTYDKSIDVKNEILVVSIIETCGFPLKKEVSKEGILAIFLSLQHGTLLSREKYFPLLKEAALKGEIEMKFIAMMEDRILLDKGERQKYGTQLIQVNDGDFKLGSLEDPSNVNRRRPEVGLNNIQDFLKSENLPTNSFEN